jgi:cyclopropane-fatty-acyl-phospholipid synthase
MVLRDAQDIGLDYAKTLRLWQQTFNSNAQRIKAIGLPDAFLRLWNYYFSYCEAGFLERHISATQMVFAKPKYRNSIGR